MELEVLNSDLINIEILDVFDSLLWTDRYCGTGDFELVTSDIIGTLRKLSGGEYLSLKESEHKMLIEGINIKSNPENGDKLIITGRSLESILDRRIINKKISLVGNFQDAIESILNSNAINCTDTDRNITKLLFDPSTDPVITNLTIEDQFYGEELYTAIFDQCLSKNVGFKIVVNSDRKFVFSLYSGIDHSYSQLTNPYVIFSKEFDNLLSSDYKESLVNLKTIAHVAGEEGIGNERRVIEVPSTGGGSDLNRREIFVDAQGVTRNIPNETPLTDEEYDNQLAQKGFEELSSRGITQIFETQIDSTRMYIYGVHFFMGDIVQVLDDYGHTKRTQVREVIHFQDGSGSSINPTFVTIE